MKSKHFESQEQTPGRPLRRDFTAYTLQHAATAKKRAASWRRSSDSQPIFQVRKESFIMKVIHRPILATLSVLVIIGASGTTYAAVNGGLSSITALFGGAKRVEDGRVVSVDVRNCHDVNPFNVVSGTGNGNATRYYRVQDNAKLNDSQVVSLVQSICRSSYNPAVDQKVMDDINNLPENKDKLVGNAVGTITAIDSHSISIEVSGDVTSNHEPFVERIPLSSNTIVFDSTGTQKTPAALKVGDTIYSSYRATGDALVNSEITPLDKVDWSKQTMVTIYKQTPDQAAYDKYQDLSNSKTLVQVTPCNSDASGYCTYDETQR